MKSEYIDSALYNVTPGVPKRYRQADRLVVARENSENCFAGQANAGSRVFLRNYYMLANVA